jgi:hypothetical protein
MAAILYYFINLTLMKRYLGCLRFEEEESDDIKPEERNGGPSSNKWGS